MGLFGSEPEKPKYNYWYIDNNTGEWKLFGQSENYYTEPISVGDFRGAGVFGTLKSIMNAKNEGLQPTKMLYSDSAKAQAIANSAKPGMREGIFKKITKDNQKSVMMREAIRNQISKGAE